MNKNDVRQIDNALYCGCEEKTTNGSGYFCKCDLWLRDRFTGDKIQKVADDIIIHTLTLQKQYKIGAHKNW